MQASQKTKFADFFIWCGYFRLSYSNKYHLFNKYTLYIYIEVSDFINCFDLRRHAEWPTLLGVLTTDWTIRAPCRRQLTATRRPAFAVIWLVYRGLISLFRYSGRTHFESWLGSSPLFRPTFIGLLFIRVCFLQQNLNKIRFPELAYTKVYASIDLVLYDGATRILARSSRVMGSSLTYNATFAPHPNYEY